MKKEITILILLVISAGCIGTPVEDSHSPPTNGSATQDNVGVDESGNTTEKGQIVAIGFSKVEKEQAEPSSILRYGNLEPEQRTWFRNAVASDDTIQVTNNSTRDFAKLLDELSQPRTQGLGEDAVDPNVYIKYNGTTYLTRLKRTNISQ